MRFRHHTLPNGLTIVGEPHPQARSVALGFFVRTGSRDETPEESGVSHFLEHMAFKGTPRRTALEVNLDFDRIGAAYNAYTSEENTVYYAAVLPEYLPQALDILADILRPSLRPEDFDTEKLVILEEIEMYDDQPGSVASEKARQVYYGPHPLGHSVLGTRESVSALTPQRMRAYFERRYAANNIVLSVAGNFDWDRLVELATAACSAWTPAEVGRTGREPWSGQGGLHVFTRSGVQQEHVLLLSPGPPADSPLRYAADLLTMAVGDDTGSRLYWALIDTGLADSADCTFYEHDGSGVVYTGLTCEPGLAASNLDLVRRVTAEVNRDGITPEELRVVKSKVAARLVRSAERPRGRMRAIASAWIYTGEYRDVDTELARYEAVTTDDIRRLLDAYPLDRTTTVAFGPLAELQGVTGRPA